MMMTAADVKELIEEIISTLPERMSGNEATPYVAEKLRSLIATDKQGVIEALKGYLSFRVAPEQRQPKDAVFEARIWMALNIADRLCLVDLRPEIESLVTDVRMGKVLSPIQEQGVVRYLKKIGTLNH